MSDERPTTGKHSTLDPMRRAPHLNAADDFCNRLASVDVATGTRTPACSRGTAFRARPQAPWRSLSRSDQELTKKARLHRGEGRFASNENSRDAAIEAGKIRSCDFLRPALLAVADL